MKAYLFDHGDEREIDDAGTLGKCQKISYENDCNSDDHSRGKCAFPNRTDGKGKGLEFALDQDLGRQWDPEYAEKRVRREESQPSRKLRSERELTIPAANIDGKTKSPFLTLTVRSIERSSFQYKFHESRSTAKLTAVDDRSILSSYSRN